MIRISILVAFLAWGTWYGGWAGFGACFCIAGFIGLFVGPPKPKVRREAVQEATGSPYKPARRQDVYEYVQARKGRRIDPTRPRD